MAKTLNKVLLIGNLGRDPEIRFLPSGQQVANFSIATKEVWTSKEGKKEEKVQWHRIVAFGKLAEICGEYLSKGRQVYIEGRLQSRDWETKDGQKRSTVEVIVQNMILLGGKGAPSVSEPEEVTYEPEKESEEDVPF